MHVQNLIYIKFEIKHQIDVYTSLHKGRNDGYGSVESTVAQASIRRLYKRQIDGYIDYF